MPYKFIYSPGQKVAHFRKMAKLTAKEMYMAVAESFQNGNTSTRAISDDIGMPQRTVCRYLERLRRGMLVEEVAERGRPSTLDARVRGHLIALLASNPFYTSKDLADELRVRANVEIDSRTVRRHLLSLRYRNGLPRNVPALTNDAMVKRLQFATANSSTNWEVVFFSDETIIQLNANLTRAWYQPGSRPRNARSRFSGKLMFWSAISTWAKFELVEIDGIMTAARYVELLHDKFVPWVRRQKKGRWVFQQDNAPSHTARLSIAFFENMRVSVLPWPPYSPDLNPIENLWGLLKRRVDARRPSDVDELRVIAKEEWAAIPMEAVRNSIRSMPTRLTNVIESNGATIDY